MSQPREEASQLIEAGFNAAELALALGIHRAMAGRYMRKYRKEKIRITALRASVVHQLKAWNLTTPSSAN